MNLTKALLTLVAVLPATALAGVEDRCGTLVKCAPDQYTTYKPIATCPPPGDMQMPAPAKKVCSAIDVAPGATIFCDKTWSGFRCNGWNRGSLAEPFEFQWTVSPPLQLQSSDDNPDVNIKCGIGPHPGGTVMLIVTSPVGLQSSTSVSLSCDVVDEQ